MPLFRWAVNIGIGRYKTHAHTYHAIEWGVWRTGWYISHSPISLAAEKVERGHLDRNVSSAVSAGAGWVR